MEKKIENLQTFEQYSSKLNIIGVIESKNQLNDEYIMVKIKHGAKCPKKILE